MLSDLIERLRAATMGFDWSDLSDDALIPAVPLLREAATAISQEREAREKAERMLALRVENPGAERYWESRWRDAEASLAEAKRLLEWRDMKSAPRDGTNILLRFPGPFSDPTETGISVGMWTGNGWWCRAIWAASSPHAEPTQWCPLPARFLSQEPNHER